MRKNLGKNTVITPLPVFVIATYDENGAPIAYDSASHLYRLVGDAVGKAFQDGLKIKNG